MSMIKKLYKQMRRAYLRRLNYYKEQGFETPQTPKIPKKVTRGSINNIKKLNDKLSNMIHDQKVETGYFTLKREEQRAKRAATKAANYTPTNKKTKKDYPKDPGARTSKPKGMDLTQPPNLSDAVLRRFESEINVAKSFVAKSKPFQDAVREAAREADGDFKINISDALASNQYRRNEQKNSFKFMNPPVGIDINKILNSYFPDFTKHDIRVAVSKELFKNYETHVTEIDSWLYEFISDGNGGLTHESVVVDAYQSLLRAIGETEINTDDQKLIQEVLNELITGETYTGANTDM